MVAPTPISSIGLKGNWQDLSPLALPPGQISPLARPIDQAAQYGQPEQNKGSFGGSLVRTAVFLGGSYGLARLGKAKLTSTEGFKGFLKKSSELVVKYLEMGPKWVMSKFKKS